VSLPAHARMLLALLQGDAAPSCTDETWRDVLSFADRSQCTIFLRHTPGLPFWFREEIEARRIKNAARRARLLAEYDTVTGALDKQSIEFVLLKGFTHEKGFGIDGSGRVQYDIDLWCPGGGHARRAEATLRALGYAPNGTAELSGVHGCPLVRPHSWRWRGDYYDPEMPVAIEVHTKLWNEQRERIGTPGLEKCWERRTAVEVDGRTMQALAEPDRVAFAALHCLRHVLHNDVRVSHVYELARFLSLRGNDTAFWDVWRSTQDPLLRRLQAVAFRFPSEWFACPFPRVLECEYRELPPRIHVWFSRFALSPIENLVRPNKDAAWLHARLAGRWTDRIAVLRERLAPLKRPDAVQAEGSYFAHFLGRLKYHAAALAPALWSGLRLRKTAPSSASHTSDWNRPSV
jgi:hypothetical protein